jgi:hypothetical protein
MELQRHCFLRNEEHAQLQSAHFLLRNAQEELGSVVSELRMAYESIDRFGKTADSRFSIDELLQHAAQKAAVLERNRAMENAQMLQLQIDQLRTAYSHAAANLQRYQQDQCDKQKEDWCYSDDEECDQEVAQLTCRSSDKGEVKETEEEEGEGSQAEDDDYKTKWEYLTVAMQMAEERMCDAQQLVEQTRNANEEELDTLRALLVSAEMENSEMRNDEEESAVHHVGLRQQVLESQQEMAQLKDQLQVMLEQVGKLGIELVSTKTALQEQRGISAVALKGRDDKQRLLKHAAERIVELERIEVSAAAEIQASANKRKEYADIVLQLNDFARKVVGLIPSATEDSVRSPDATDATVAVEVRSKKRSQKRVVVVLK